MFNNKKPSDSDTFNFKLITALARLLKIDPKDLVDAAADDKENLLFLLEFTEHRVNTLIKDNPELEKNIKDSAKRYGLDVEEI